MGKEGFFTGELLKWDDEVNQRAMPWKYEKNPYRIWISEIILQQTRVEQGLEYYKTFIRAYPDVTSLANAPDADVFKLWEGLGYYSRCKNLLTTARHIAGNLYGKFPDKYEDILALKGIGPYTAAAIASFAYNQPYAVVDGNVFRVLARYFGIHLPVDSTEGKKYFTALAEKLLDKKNPAQYNQAIMDFGATICKPVPLCNDCPLNAECTAWKNEEQLLLPVKGKKILRKERYFTYLVVSHGGKTYIRKREQKDIWQNLYEFILVETESPVMFSDLRNSVDFKNIIMEGFEIERSSPVYKQQLTHQTIYGQFIHLNLHQPLTTDGYFPVSPDEIKRLPFPKFIASYLKD